MAEHPKPKGRSCSHRRYKLSCDDYDALVLHARGRCQICRRKGEETGHGYLVVDHDDKLGYSAVRGLLCNTCNSQLAYFNLPEESMRAYLDAPWRGIEPAKRGAKKEQTA
jgi:hypothetical protein